MDKNIIQENYGLTIQRQDVTYKNFLHTHYVIYTVDKKYFLKAYSLSDNATNLIRKVSSIHKFLLCNQQYVPAILTTVSNELFFVHNQSLYVLFEYIEHEPFNIDKKTMYSAGISVAHLHQALKNVDCKSLAINADGLSCVDTITRLKSEYLHFMDSYKEHNAESIESNIIGTICKNIQVLDSVQNHLVKGKVTQLVHGDLNSKNILKVGDLFAFIDFDEIRIDSPARDVACLFISIYAHVKNEHILGLLEHFIQGYTHIGTMSFDEVYYYMLFETAYIVALFLNKIKVYMRISQHGIIIQNCLDCFEYLTNIY